MEIIEIESDDEIDERYYFICETINRIIKNSIKQLTMSYTFITKSTKRRCFRDETTKRPTYIYLKSSYVRSLLKENDNNNDDDNMDLIIKMLLEATDTVIPQSKEEEYTLFKTFWENNQLKLKTKYKNFSKWYKSMKEELFKWRTLMEVNIYDKNQCSNDCYKEKDNFRFNFINTVSDEYKIRDAMMIHGRNYCEIAKMMNPMTCNQVFKIVGENMIINFCTDKKPFSDFRTLNQKTKFLKQRDGEKELIVEDISFYQPCNHHGRICDEMCSCYSGNNFCEKYCGCDSTCLNKFSGCLCSSRCNSKLCACFLMNRECDPELCMKHDVENCACKNMMLQSGTMKNLEVKLSTIEGIGLGTFAAETIEAKDFIIEYSGELITNNEAERRADFYAKIKSIYIFGLCKQYSIDAYKIGNESRFINHSNTPNCEAKILTVKGDKRIAIYAKRRININEELFFSYNFSEKHEELYFKK